MFHTRTTKTSSGAIAVQVVRYDNRQVRIAAHLGSAHNDEELLLLKKCAADWIKKASRQQSLFKEDRGEATKLILLDKCQFLGIRYSFIYEVISRLFEKFNFHLLPNSRKMLLDLTLIRIVEPASKLHSFELLDEYFDIQYDRKEFYRYLNRFAGLKDKIENEILALAKRELNFDFSLVFYDVTTLYFETFKSDELRRTGFSKDNKPQQPQILIGLIVNTLGFPVAYDIFKGNTFEGHTIIPVISAFKKKHQIEKLTVVADAAMISLDNIRALEDNQLSYIVGARIGNLPNPLIAQISRQLNQTDRASWRTITEHGDLIYDFSVKRYRKDKAEMDKQLKKAESLLQSSRSVKRAKFIRNKDKTNYELNTKLIEKTKQLLGVKGYYTNLPTEINNAEIISQYHNLWKIEQAFRIAKSDLEIRPIYHFKEQAIQTHVLICFMALAICKYMEIKTGESTRQIIKSLKTVADARILNTLTRKEIIMQSEITDDIKRILSKFGLSY